MGLAFGGLALSVGVAFLLIRSDVGGLTGLIFGTLLQVLGVASAAHAAADLARSLPLSEPAGSAHRILGVSGAVVLAAAVTLAALWTAVVIGTSAFLLPALPLFWGPLSAIGALGLLYAARELASERMAVLAAVGAGGVLGVALSSGGAVLMDPVRTLTSARLVADLFLVGLGFLAMGAAFERDAWAVRLRRTP